MDPYEVPIYYRREQEDKFYLLPWIVSIETRVLVLQPPSSARKIVGDGASNCACLCLPRQQAIEHLGAPYDFCFTFY